MNRRDFLKRMAAVGLVAATPKIIFDLGANRHRHIFAALDPGFGLDQAKVAYYEMVATHTGRLRMYSQIEKMVKESPAYTIGELSLHTHSWDGLC